MNKNENIKHTWKRTLLQKNVRKMFNLKLTSDNFCYNILDINQPNSRIPTTESFINLEKFVYADINYLFYLLIEVDDKIEAYDHFRFNKLKEISQKLKGTNTNDLESLTMLRKNRFNYYKKRMNWVVTENCNDKVKEFLDSIIERDPPKSENIKEFELADNVSIEIRGKNNLVNLMCNNDTLIKEISTDVKESLQICINNINKYIKKGEHFPIFLIMNNKITDYRIKVKEYTKSNPNTDAENLTLGHNKLKQSKEAPENNNQSDAVQIDNCGILYVLSFMQKAIHTKCKNILTANYFARCQMNLNALMQENYPQVWADIKKLVIYEKSQIFNNIKQVHPEKDVKKCFYIELAKYIRKNFIEDKSINQVGPILNQIHNFDFKNDDSFEVTTRHEFLEKIITEKLLEKKVIYPKLKTLENNTIKISNIESERKNKKNYNKAIVKFWETSLDTNIK